MKQRPRSPLLENMPDDEAEKGTTIFIDSPADVKAAEGSTAPVEWTKEELLTKHESSASPRHNTRRTPTVMKQVVISVVVSLTISLLALYAGHRFYEREIVPVLTSAVRSGPPPESAAVDPSPSNGADKKMLADLAEKIAALTKQADLMRREQLIMQQNTREAIERLSGAASPQPAVAAAPEIVPNGTPGVARMAEASLQVSPTQEEFILLKERNRLTFYADEAIATGMRKPLEAIVEYLRDPDSKHLHEAAQVEYMRAVRAIQLLQREDPGFRLPVADLFKDKSIRDEADVKPEALLKLLSDYKQSWEVRVRVCFLLLGSPLPETNAALIKAIKEDPSLEVAKHAQIALEQRVKKRFRIFDIPAIEEWAKSQTK